MSDNNLTDNILIKFNTETTTNCPKFELKNGLYTIQRDEISLSILSQSSSNETTDTIIGDIISFYKMTGNPEFITQNMVIPFSFLLVDLNVHKPQYSAFIFIQPYEMSSFYIENTENSIINIGSIVKGGVPSGVGLGLLQPCKIYVFALDAKAIAYWKFDYVAVIGTPPPFYVSVTDFYTMLDTDGMTKTDTEFLLNVLVQVSSTTNPLYYNYRVTQLLQGGTKFQQDSYLKRHRIMQYYLLIHPFERFNKREEIISKISA
jgi:hypothetical protein